LPGTFDSIMSAFIIVDIDIKNPARYEDYKKLTPATLIPFDGKFVVRGGPVEILEGDWKPGRFVMLKFPSVEKAKAWWTSEIYAEAKAIRQSCSEANMILVEGT
jgi:uncharacterized protein (DUF1330 family)